jgi:formamidopyrimidine-DNA glycosylase
MPELPEVQAHAERLTDRYAGAVLERFSPLTFTALKTARPSPQEAVGTPLDEVGRRGKYLLARFGERTFVVHLMQGGRLREDAKQSAKPRGGIARWRFTDGRALLLTEAGTERKAGVWCAESAGVLDHPPLAGLGPEAMLVTADELAARFAERNMRLHTFLRDQGCIAGLGRRLANEVCHRALLSPFSMTGKLGAAGAAAVVAAISDAGQEGLAVERARDDMSSSAERPGGVHRRTGEPCPVCGDTIREVEYSSYTVHYCATCQTGGKVLADNTTSKFLK